MATTQDEYDETYGPIGMTDLALEVATVDTTQEKDFLGRYLAEERANGERYGYDSAMLVVSQVVNELYDVDDAPTARLIHDKVWRRLNAERAARVES
jgi:hypothetical protein